MSVSLQNNISHLANLLASLPSNICPPPPIPVNIFPIKNEHHLFDHCQTHGISSLVYHNVKTLGHETKWLPNTHVLFKKAYFRTLSHNLILKHALQELGVQLHTQFPIIILKGFVLIQNIYINTGLRPMSDIDILIHPKDMATAKNTFRKLGYASSSKYPDIFLKNDIQFDLHEDPLNANRIEQRKKAVILTPQDLWDHAIPIPQLAPFYQLSPSHQIITLSNHALKHGFARKIWLLDLLGYLHLMETDTTAQDQFITQCKQANALSFFQICLHILPKHLLYPLPQWAQNLQKSFPISPTRLKIIDATINTEPFQILEPLILSANFSQFMTFLWEMAFPKRSVLSQISGFSGPWSFWLSYPYRGLQLTFKGIVQLLLITYRFFTKRNPTIP